MYHQCCLCLGHACQPSLGVHTPAYCPEHQAQRDRASRQLAMTPKPAKANKSCSTECEHPQVIFVGASQETHLEDYVRALAKTDRKLAMDVLEGLLDSPLWQEK